MTTATLSAFEKSRQLNDSIRSIRINYDLSEDIKNVLDLLPSSVEWKQPREYRDTVRFTDKFRRNVLKGNDAIVTLDDDKRMRYRSLGSTPSYLWNGRQEFVDVSGFNTPLGIGGMVLVKQYVQYMFHGKPGRWIYRMTEVWMPRAKAEADPEIANVMKQRRNRGSTETNDAYRFVRRHCIYSLVGFNNPFFTRDDQATDERTIDLSLEYKTERLPGSDEFLIDLPANATVSKLTVRDSMICLVTD